MKAKIKSIFLQNFKGCKGNTYQFNGENATVSGANATGKTTILDAFWWCLFNKDSLGNEKFSIRPLDADGKQIDNLEIKVVVTLDVDGREMEFSKLQKQKWVKRRGSEVAELQGNENIYEIDGYPKTEKDYKKVISDLVSEDAFKMLTNPAYFPSLKWKEQREILMRFVSEVSDYELASGEVRFAELLDEIQKAPSTDDIKNKYLKALNEWKKQQAELPVRIDEAEKSKVDIDVAELELQKNLLKEKLEENKAKQNEVNKVISECETISRDIMQLQFEMNDLSRKANEENIHRRRELEDKISDKMFLIKQTEKTIDDCNKFISLSNRNIENIEEQIEKYREQYRTLQGHKFDENSLVCTYCGQEYPANKKEKIKEEFTSSKTRELNKIMEKANSLKAELEKARASVTEMENELPQHKESLKMLNDAIAEFKNQLSTLPEHIDVTEMDEYKAIKSKITEKELAMARGNDAESTKQELGKEKLIIELELLEVEKKFALSSKNIEVDERISELQAEQRTVAQKVADQEKMLYLLEEFIRFKMDTVSDCINKKFDGVNFKLFDNQINGGLKETCELTVDGVPYSSLNNGHKIVAGLQIIKALQGLYDVSMPTFVDNAESVNDFNLPNMDCQLVLLKVSEDKMLKVEV